MSHNCGIGALALEREEDHSAEIDQPTRGISKSRTEYRLMKKMVFNIYYMADSYCSCPAAQLTIGTSYFCPPKFSHDHTSHPVYLCTSQQCSFAVLGPGASTTGSQLSQTSQPCCSSSHMSAASSAPAVLHSYSALRRHSAVASAAAAAIMNHSRCCCCCMKQVARQIRPQPRGWFDTRAALQDEFLRPLARLSPNCGIAKSPQKRPPAAAAGGKRRRRRQICVGGGDNVSGNATKPVEMGLR